MQKSRGISMISLVVTIVCMILLSSMAIEVGLRYNKETKNRDEKAFVDVLSSAVSTRHEETNLDSVNYPYVGYYIKDEEKFNSIFLPKIKTNSKFENGIWYVVDNVSADKLGVKKAENYIEKVDEINTKDAKVALVNYANGETYIINVNANEMKDLDFSDNNQVDGHMHTYTITEPTCTEGVVCTKCGFILKEPLGHTYGDSLISAEPVDDNTHYRKACLRCHMQGDYEPHTFVYEHLKVDGAWYHKKKCPLCGWESANIIPCTIIYKISTNADEAASNHIATCKECEHSESEAHMLAYREISQTKHEVYCSKCNYSIRNEDHIDNNKDNICDLCDYEMGDYLYPVIKSCVMINKDATTEEGKYYAKYDNIVEITFETVRPVKNVQVTIAGQEPTKISSSTENKKWTIEYKIANGIGITNGNIKFSIMCESSSGIAMQKAQTTTTDGKYVVFDGNSPVIEYINKAIRALTGG